MGPWLNWVPHTAERRLSLGSFNDVENTDGFRHNIVLTTCNGNVYKGNLYTGGIFPWKFFRVTIFQMFIAGQRMDVVV